jgi:hypothetical protein
MRNRAVLLLDSDPQGRIEDLQLSVTIDPVLRSSQRVRVGFIFSPENCIELILMGWEIISLTADLSAHQSIPGNPASAFHSLK